MTNWLEKVHDDVKTLNVKLTTGGLPYGTSTASVKEFFVDKILTNSKTDENVESLVDSGGARDVSPGFKFFHLQNTLGVCVPLKKILDSPLHVHVTLTILGN